MRRKIFKGKLSFKNFKKHSPWEQNGLPPMVNIVQIALANLRAWVEHLTSQPSWLTAWLLVTCVSPVYLVVDEFSPCVLWPLMIGLMVVSLTFFFNTMSMFLLKGSWCRECVWNLRTKLCYIASRKWNVSRFHYWNVLGLTNWNTYQWFNG